MKLKQTTQLLIGLIVSLFTASSFAFTNELTLDFQDAHIKGKNVIFLKKALKDQYPHINLHNQHLKSIVVVGKSKHGHGEVSMRLKDWVSAPETIAGNRYDFRRDTQHTFDYITLDNTQHYSHGRWQLLLKGNFKIRKVILVMEDNRLATKNWWQPIQANFAPRKKGPSYRSSFSKSRHNTRHNYLSYY